MKWQRTKIVCTVGPASSSLEIIRSLIEAGMDAARLNFSHGSYDQHAGTIANIRAAAKQLDKRVAILQDLSGPKMRIGTFADGAIELVEGAEFVLTTRSVPGDHWAVSMNCPPLVEAAEVGNRILLGDGVIELRVLSTTETDICCRVVVGGELTSHKGISAPGVAIKGTVPTEKDRADLVFGLQHGVDWVAQSFVRCADELRTLRSIIREHGADVPIIAKLEKREAIEDLDAIIAEADGVMVARGDLGLEIGLPEVPFAQKEIIQRTGLAGKPDITATQMLESMIVNPRPTRAEVSDVANAVFDGTDAVMLSGETAIGKYPVEACKMVARITAAAEERIDYVEAFMSNAITLGGRIDDAVAHAACQTALELDAAAIICCTRSGQTARRVSSHRPHAPVVVASPDENTLRRTLLLWGTYPVKTHVAENTDQMIAEAKQAVLRDGLAERGSKVVIVAGTPGDQGGTTNTLKADVL